MTPLECVTATTSLMAETFMMDPATRQAARDRGMKSWPAYFVGRGGVLGDVDAGVIDAAFVFFPPSSVARGWASGQGVLTPAEAAAFYADLAASWGRTRFAGLEGVERFAELAARVVDGAAVGGIPLFAAWRAYPRPADAAGRAGLLLHCLRELRGGLHGVAVVAAGIDPLSAIMAGPYGEGNAAWFGWAEPFPVVTPELAERWQAAEERTVGLVAAAYATLTAEELAELVGLAEQARAGS